MVTFIFYKLWKKQFAIMWFYKYYHDRSRIYCWTHGFKKWNTMSFVYIYITYQSLFLSSLYWLFSISFFLPFSLFIYYSAWNNFQASRHLTTELSIQELLETRTVSYMTVILLLHLRNLTLIHIYLIYNLYTNSANDKGLFFEIC